MHIIAISCSCPWMYIKKEIFKFFKNLFNCFVLLTTIVDSLRLDALHFMIVLIYIDLKNFEAVYQDK